MSESMKSEDISVLLSSWLHEVGNAAHSLNGWIDLYEKKAVKNGQPNEAYFEKLNSQMHRLIFQLEVLRNFTEFLSDEKLPSDKKHLNQMIELLTAKIRKEIALEEIPQSISDPASLRSWLSEIISDYRD